MKILITTDWYEPVINGVVISVVNLSRELKARGHEVKILTLSRNHHTYIDGDVIYAASIGAGKIYPEARLKMPVIKAVIDKLIEWKPDVIHSQCELSTFFMAKKIADETNAPIVHTYHTIYEDYTHYFSPNAAWGRKVVQKLTRMLSSRVEAMIAPSRKIEDVLEKYDVLCPVEVIPSGIDTDKFGKYIETDGRYRIRQQYGLSKEQTVLLYVGRLAKEKNTLEILRCQKRVSRYGTILMIVGDGPYRSEIEEQVRELEISESVIFTGMIEPDKVAEYYQAGDFFVSASTSETQGLTYVEALAAGIPLLCREDPCLIDVVDNGKNGWEFTDEETFENALVKWLDMSAASRQQLRRNAVQSADKFSTAIFADRVEKLYMNVCELQALVLRAC